MTLDSICRLRLPDCSRALKRIQRTPEGSWDSLVRQGAGRSPGQQAGGAEHLMRLYSVRRYPLGCEIVATLQIFLIPVLWRAK